MVRPLPMYVEREKIENEKEQAVPMTKVELQIDIIHRESQLLSKPCTEYQETKKQSEGQNKVNQECHQACGERRKQRAVERLHSLRLEGIVGAEFTHCRCAPFPVALQFLFVSSSRV
jgi:hypothetical protein